MLRFIIYFICFFILLHFGLHFFDIDIFELFDRKTENVDEISPPSTEIHDTISELEKSIQELKEVSSI